MVSKSQLLMARARAAQQETTIEDYTDTDTTDANAMAKVSRSGYGRLPVYKLTPTGVERIYVAVQSIVDVLNTPGYSASCFDCEMDECGPGVNDCPGRPPRQFRICPINTCRKPIYDTKPTGKFKQDDFDNSHRPTEDKNAIVDEAYSASTPETRTRAALDMHLLGFHPAESLAMGINRVREITRKELVN